MLQQTRVETVIPYYERFLEKWPTVSDLAQADPSEVLAAWSGLGYYRRARLMLRAADAVVRDHQAALPRDVEQLRALPGFGRYTAGAVASIAFGLEAPAVDGNVMRVLARLYGIEGDTSTGDGNKEVWRAAEALVLGEAPGDLNQALIELGATVCSPRSPECERCPVRAFCVAKREGNEELIPPPRKRARRAVIETTALLLVDLGGHVLLEAQPPEGLFADLWCLPMLEGRLEPEAASDEAARSCGFELMRAEVAAEVKHVLTHRDILMRVIAAECVGRERGGETRGRGGASLARDEAALAGDEASLARDGASLAHDGGSRGRAGRAQGKLRWVMLEELVNLGIPSMTVRALQASLPKNLLARARLPGRRAAQSAQGDAAHREPHA